MYYKSKNRWDSYRQAQTRAVGLAQYKAFYSAYQVLFAYEMMNTTSVEMNSEELTRLLTCPYSGDHKIASIDIFLHLAKCRKDYYRKHGPCIDLQKLEILFLLSVYKLRRKGERD
ncbi:unnamed protein product [Toxocara canis]|uniref:CHHC U11-48K-type domain-containing protein n=1 Tax=Toxocara canis TaxID=6265 RepID=A0A183UJ29_TOXCA|nr:unnamed protein product [Toxocara canis]